MLKKQPIDWVSAVLLALALASLLLGITKGREWGWESARIPTLFIASPVMLLLFLAYEKRYSHPLVDLSLFRSTVFTSNNFALLLGFAPLGAAHFLMPFYLQGPRGFTPQETGIILLPFPFGNTLGSLVIGRLTARFSFFRPQHRQPSVYNRWLYHLIAGRNGYFARRPALAGLRRWLRYRRVPNRDHEPDNLGGALGTAR